VHSLPLGTIDQPETKDAKAPAPLAHGLADGLRFLRLPVVCGWLRVDPGNTKGDPIQSGANRTGRSSAAREGEAHASAVAAMYHTVEDTLRVYRNICTVRTAGTMTVFLCMYGARSMRACVAGLRRRGVRAERRTGGALGM
jgi:hypothetical protein